MTISRLGIPSVGGRDVELNPALVTHRSASDVFEQAKNLPEWHQSYWQLSNGGFDGETWSASMNGLQIFRERMNRAVDQQGDAPAGRLVVGVANGPVGEGFWGGRALHDDSVLLLTDASELTFKTPIESDFSFMTVSRELLGERCSSVELELLEQALKVRPAAERVASVHAARLRTILNLALNSAVDRNTYAYEFLTSDLCLVAVAALGTPGIEREARTTQRVHRYIVNAVRDRILSDPGNPPTVSQLCIHLKISQRSLHHAFQQVLGVSPVKYLRTVRLHLVRRALRTSPPTPGRIQQAALDCGFWHLGMFAKQYVELFGELPSKTTVMPH